MKYSSSMAKELRKKASREVERGDIYA